ncbi:uncharacterized protein LOC117815586 [Xyrichtys novacula]|uniref:Uncharacterized protein LOC117815586 n=1 Tax=Xyrichtys novacula TaxID=13765 RepID=A0AAV1EYP8_XYRNO|nr:uncharacterized protein LOC117815586 [Xyrichtys novacula]
MPAPKVLLLDTLENLCERDFNKLKWFLNSGISNNDTWRPIPVSRLEKATEIETVREMTQSFGEDRAVEIAVEILREMGLNDPAAKLESKHKGGKTSAPSTSAAAAPPPAAPAPSAAPASLTAQDGGVIFAPNLVGGTSGAWNITINKYTNETIMNQDN